MGELGTITFYGESGKSYLFHTYDKYTEFKDVSAVVMHPISQATFKRVF